MKSNRKNFRSLLPDLSIRAECAPNLKNERLLVYKNRFEEADPDQLERFDEISFHYSILYKEEVMGGFRVTPVKNRSSEVEKLFPDFSFIENSVELGRFWLRPDIQNSGIGFATLTLLFENEGLLSKQNVLLKTSKLIGMTTERFGFQSTGLKSFNSHLGYNCYLYFRASEIEESNYGFINREQI